MTDTPDTRPSHPSAPTGSALDMPPAAAPHAADAEDAEDGGTSADGGTATTPPGQALADLWRLAGLPPEALSCIHLSGAEPMLPSSFAVGTAAQAAIGAAALAAAEVRHQRGLPRQAISLDMRHAAQECSNWFSLDGVVPPVWDKLSGLYPCGGPDGSRGWVRIHANFAHHRDGALRLLGLPAGEATEREAVTRALCNWDAEAFEQAAADAGLVVAAVRSFAQWDAHPQAQALAALPPFTLSRIGDADPMPLPPLSAPQAQPLQGLRVLELTRILAGPVAGRTLAAYGAEVMLVNAPHLPNVSVVAETSRGKLSAFADLRTAEGRGDLQALAGSAHVFMQGYRPGGLDALGFGPQDLARRRPGIVHVSLSAYGHAGPWAGRRGFDSLVQTATGFNDAEGRAAGSPQPRALPCQILDHASGYLMALGAQAALIRQQREGGSWLVRVSLAQTALWLRGLGRLPQGLATPQPALEALLETIASGFGTLRAVRHSAVLADTPALWRRPSMPPGSHPMRWA